MGAPVPKVEPVDNATAEALLSPLEGMTGAERRKHASIFNYWLSIRGDRQFPPIRDLDPLEISDAGPWSILLEMIAAGENAVIRHLGQAIKLGVEAETIARAPNPSLLACIHARLPTIASSMQALAFEDEFATTSGTARCWVTLLPFSASGSWIDYVYCFVSLDTGEPKPAADEIASVGEAPEPAQELDSFQVPLRALDDPDIDADATPVEAALEVVEPEAQPETQVEIEAEPEPALAPEPLPELEAEFEADMGEPEYEPLTTVERDITPEVDRESDIEPEQDGGPGTELEPLPGQDETALSAKAGFSAMLMESVSGFYGRVVHAAPSEPVDETVADEGDEPIDEAVAEDPGHSIEDVVANVADPVDTPVAEEIRDHSCEAEGTLQSKLTEVRAMAEEARQALLRSELALYAGLSAAYDFALDAENEPEEYLRLVEGQGLKIQLRAPMKPVVKLAFSDTCDETTIGQLEAVLAWALKQDLPRGSLAERIEAEGGIGAILEGLGKAA